MKRKTAQVHRTIVEKRQLARLRALEGFLGGLVRRHGALALLRKFQNWRRGATEEHIRQHWQREVDRLKDEVRRLHDDSWQVCSAAEDSIMTLRDTSPNPN